MKAAASPTRRKPFPKNRLERYGVAPHTARSPISFPSGTNRDVIRGFASWRSYVLRSPEAWPRGVTSGSTMTVR